MAELIQYANGVPGIKWPIDKSIVKLGRSDSMNDISVDDSYASKSHAQIEIVFSEETNLLEYHLRDLQSTNHTYLNQSPVDHVKLEHNDIVMIGKSKFVFLIDGTREYISPAEVRNYTAAELEQEAEESLSIALDEITREFNTLKESDMDKTLFANKPSKQKFSRRLSIY